MDYVAVILPAAGSGERLQNLDPQVPKQYLEVMGKPLASYAVEAFDELSWVNKIILVMSDTELGTKVTANVADERVAVIKGGHSRHESIHLGLQYFNEEARETPDIIIVHDAVRPMVPDENWLLHLVMKAKLHGAVGFIQKQKSNLITQTADGFLENMYDGADFVASETPQAFKYGVLKEAYDKSTEEDVKSGTECLKLVLDYTDVKPNLVEGPSELWKVTYKKDFFGAVGYLQEITTRVLILTHDNKIDDTVAELKECFLKKVDHVECHLFNPRCCDVKKKLNCYEVVISFCNNYLEIQRMVKVGSMNAGPQNSLLVIVKEHTPVVVPALLPHRLSRITTKLFNLCHRAIIIFEKKGGTGYNAQKITNLIEGIKYSNDLYTFSGQTFYI